MAAPEGTALRLIGAVCEGGGSTAKPKPDFEPAEVMKITLLRFFSTCPGERSSV
jgi:hypothetical protein